MRLKGDATIGCIRVFAYQGKGSMQASSNTFVEQTYSFAAKTTVEVSLSLQRFVEDDRALSSFGSIVASMIKVWTSIKVGPNFINSFTQNLTIFTGSKVFAFLR